MTKLYYTYKSLIVRTSACSSETAIYVVPDRHRGKWDVGFYPFSTYLVHYQMTVVRIREPRQVLLLPFLYLAPNLPSSVSVRTDDSENDCCF